MNHTKGIWKVTEKQVHVDGDKELSVVAGRYHTEVCVLGRWVGGKSTTAQAIEVRADAMLIAAAPDLLEAAKIFQEGWSNFLDKTNIAKSTYGAREIKFMMEVAAQISEAINKAETKTTSNV